MKTIRKEGWKFTLQIIGDDLIVSDTTATWFGGKNDPLDDGQTASGVRNDGRDPALLGCALPVCWYSYSTFNSPFIPVPHPARRIPAIPWHTPVIITCGERSLTVPLIDNGPAASAGDGIDLTPAAFRALGGTLAHGVLPVSYRIPCGARFLT